MSLITMSFSATILILAIVIIRALLLHKLPKKTFFILWGVALCRLLIPFQVSSRFSIYSVLNILKGRASGGDFPLSGIPVMPSNVTMPSNTAVPEAAAPLPESVYTDVSPLLIIWLIGLVVCALFFLVTHLRCRREYKTALPVDHAFVRLWQQEHQMWRKIQIRQSDRISTPLTYGIFRPVILLPKQTDWTDETRLRYILAHEFVHVRRFDTLTKLVMAAAFCVHWFNPFVWVMYVLANRDIELSCDETVVRTFGAMTKSAYALTLIEMAEKKSRLAPLVNNFSKNAVEERIVSIMKIKKTSLVGIVLAFMLVIGTTTVFATNAASAAVTATGGKLENSLNSGTRENLRFNGTRVYEGTLSIDLSVDLMEKIAGYVPDYVESFSNGFYLKQTPIDNVEMLDSGNKLMEYKEIIFYYTKENNTPNGQTVILSAHLEDSRIPEAITNTEESLYKDIRLTYSQITNKDVPEGYVPTEEEKQKEDQGLLWISEGFENVEISNVQLVEWIKDGIVYSLSSKGGNIEKDKIFDMAKEVIDSRQ